MSYKCYFDVLYHISFVDHVSFLIIVKHVQIRIPSLLSSKVALTPAER